MSLVSVRLAKTSYKTLRAHETFFFLLLFFQMDESLYGDQERKSHSEVLVRQLSSHLTDRQILEGK